MNKIFSTVKKSKCVNMHAILHLVTPFRYSYNNNNNNSISKGRPQNIDRFTIKL